MAQRLWQSLCCSSKRAKRLGKGRNPRRQNRQLLPAPLPPQYRLAHHRSDGAVRKFVAVGISTDSLSPTGRPCPLMYLGHQIGDTHNSDGVAVIKRLLPCVLITTPAEVLLGGEDFPLLIDTHLAFENMT